MIDYVIYALFSVSFVYSFIKFVNICSITKKYENKDNDSNISGCEIAQKILEDNNLNNIYVIETKNPFEQGYSSSRKVIKLSKKIFNDTNISSFFIGSMVATNYIEEKNNKLLYVRNLLKLTIDILSIICEIAFILSILLRDLYILKIVIGIFIFIFIYNILGINLQKYIINKTKYNVKDEKIDIDEIKIAYYYYFVAQPFLALRKLIKRF